MDEGRIMEFVEDIPRNLTPFRYNSSKRALVRWMRQISPSWVVDGLHINSVTPGNTTTPMTQGMVAEQIDAALLIPIPTCYGRKEFLGAGEIANGTIFLVSPMVSGINGAVLSVDNGIGALFRSEQI